MIRVSIHIDIQSTTMILLLLVEKDKKMDLRLLKVLIFNQTFARDYRSSYETLIHGYICTDSQTLGYNYCCCLRRKIEELNSNQISYVYCLLLEPISGMFHYIVKMTVSKFTFLVITSNFSMLLSTQHWIPWNIMPQIIFNSPDFPPKYSSINTCLYPSVCYCSIGVAPQRKASHLKRGPVVRN